MKLVVDTTRLRTLVKKGVTAWQLMFLLFLEESDPGADGWAALPVTDVEVKLGIKPPRQSQLLTALKAHGLIETRLVGTGAVRRQFRILTPTGTRN